MSIEWRPMKARTMQDAIKGETKMMWVDYTINSLPGKGFKVEGDTPTEVMDKGLYKTGDVFIVNEGGWLIKSDELSAMIIKHEAKKKELA